MIAKLGMKRKVTEGEAEKEGLKEIEEEFQGLYEEMIKEVAEAVSCFPLSKWYILKERLIQIFVID